MTKKLGVQDSYKTFQNKRDLMFRTWINMVQKVLNIFPF